ncbi:MAG: T9SS type A sorting domain-containing protein [bacterium]
MAYRGFPVVVWIVLSVCAAVAQDKVEYYRHLNDPGRLAQEAESSGWPARTGVHETSQLRLSTDYDGGVGIYGPQEARFEFPKGSGCRYLYQGYLWVGGIVDGDTIVSQPFEGYFWDSTGGLSWDPRQTFVPPLPFTELGGSLAPISFGDRTSYRSIFLDTLPVSNPAHWPPRHMPLGIEVVQRSYSLDIHPFDKIVLIDFTITNVGISTIEDAFIGLHTDADVYYGPNDNAGYTDDLVGALRDINTCYAIDDDGDPAGVSFVPDRSIVDAMGFRPTRIYPHVSDTNFNWWVDNWSGELNFGPRLRPTEGDPYRQFQSGGTGVATNDVERYYFMSHPEWDYDMLRTASIGPDDSLWMDPGPADSVVDFAYGYDARMFMSVGPVDLPPDSSMRAVFAYFAGEFVHVDPLNGRNLWSGRPDEYYNNLHFGLLRLTAERAVEMTDYVLDPMQPPTGLRQHYIDADSVVIRWDPWVFPEVTGYNLYVRPIAWPSGSPEKGSTDKQSQVSSIHIPAGSRQTALYDLPPGRPYIASLAHVTDKGEGSHSIPILISDPDVTAKPTAPKMNQRFAIGTEQDSAVRFSWSPTSSDVRWYRIYRSGDSATVADRYSRSISDDSAAVAATPVSCDDYDGLTLCLYQMTPYDSVPGYLYRYTDAKPRPGDQYWVTAVMSSGVESNVSDVVRWERVAPADKDILVVLGAGSHQTDFALQDSMTAFYDRLLAGLDYDLYVWTDTNISTADFRTDWRDLADYELVVVEECPRPRVLGPQSEQEHRVLTRLIEAGRNVAYFGIPPGDQDPAFTGFLGKVDYRQDSFEKEYMGLDSALIRSFSGHYGAILGTADSLAGFDAARPESDGLPRLYHDPDRNCFTHVFRSFFITDSCLPYTPAFYPDSSAEVIYRYGSHYPETSELVDLPCGIRINRDSSRVNVFSFHLWGMQVDGARELIDYLILTPPPKPAPPPLPKGFQLAQNYPNPFNQSTTISFFLPVSGRVSLDVYNILGQQVARLVDNEWMYGGIYQTVRWNGANASGDDIASGVYFYRLSAGEQSATRKMTLLK